jgi:uncharacterized membrane protein
MPLTRILGYAILAAHVVFAVAVWGGLPDRIPMHLDLGGNVTREGARTLLSWFLLPAIAVATVALVQGIGRLLPAKPHLFNFPEKERFLRLPRERQGPVIAEMRTMLDIVVIEVAGIMLAVQVHLWRVAHGESSTLMPLLLVVAGVVLTPLALLRLGRVSEAVEQAEREAPAAGG